MRKQKDEERNRFEEMDEQPNRFEDFDDVENVKKGKSDIKKWAERNLEEKFINSELLEHLKKRKNDSDEYEFWD